MKLLCRYRLSGTSPHPSLSTYRGPGGKRAADAGPSSSSLSFSSLAQISSSLLPSPLRASTGYTPLTGPSPFSSGPSLYSLAPLPALSLSPSPPLNLHYIFACVIVAAVTAFLVAHIPRSGKLIAVVVAIVFAVSVVLTDTTRGLDPSQYERQEETPQCLVCEVPSMSRIVVDGTFVIFLVSVALLLPLFGKARIALVPVQARLVTRRRFLLLFGGIVVGGRFLRQTQVG